MVMSLMGTCNRGAVIHTSPLCAFLLFTFFSFVTSQRSECGIDFFFLARRFFKRLPYLLTTSLPFKKLAPVDRQSGQFMGGDSAPLMHFLLPSKNPRYRIVRPPGCLGGAKYHQGPCSLRSITSFGPRNPLYRCFFLIPRGFHRASCLEVWTCL